MTFYLGTDMPGWLGRLDVPLFVSHRRLMRRVTLPRASAPWALDSGAFTEIAKSGRFETPPREYAEAARRYAEGVGRLEWAATQDWMCEPDMLARTGKTIAEHQALSVESFLTLRDLAPEVRWVPTVQGWEVDDYLACAERYAAAGVDLAAAPVVGVGSVCRRQATGKAAQVFAELAALGLRLHGFGLKTNGLPQCSAYLASADSMAWSHGARKRKVRLPGCTHANCSHCPRYALEWRGRVLEALGRRCQNRFTFGRVEY